MTFQALKNFTKYISYSHKNCNDISIKCKKLKKQVIIRKSFTGDSNTRAKILELKDASSVIKRMNWENTNLFGPIQSTENNQYYNKKQIRESNKILQHRSHIPLPVIDFNSQSPTTTIQTSTPANGNNSDFNISLSRILDFPLMNKNVIENSMQTEMDEFNSLRRFLEEKGSSKMPSVSTILQKTMPPESVKNLERWKKSMIDELGADGFEKYQKQLLTTGSSLHSHINNYLTVGPETDINIDENLHGYWKSLKVALSNVGGVKLLEEYVTHPFLQYRGIVDCFAMYKNNLVVIDWKTSMKTKPTIESTFDQPLQIAAYVGALNFDPRFQYLACKGLLVIAYQNGSLASSHFIDENRMTHYWKKWLERVKLYREMTDNSNSL